MKVWKKNLVAAAVLVTVCAGIYVNWLYTEQSAAVSLVDTLDTEKVMSEDLVLSEDLAALAAGEDVQTTTCSRRPWPTTMKPGSRKRNPQWS